MNNTANIINNKNEFINNSIKQIKHLYNFTKYDYFDLKAIIENYKIANIIKIERDLEHDGYDMYGPKSDLWDLKITYMENDKKYLTIWHRENWFTGDGEEYFFSKKEEVNN
jgi:hypothetical protein